VTDCSFHEYGDLTLISRRATYPRKIRPITVVTTALLRKRGQQVWVKGICLHFNCRPFFSSNRAGLRSNDYCLPMRSASWRAIHSCMAEATSGFVRFHVFHHISPRSMLNAPRQIRFGPPAIRCAARFQFFQPGMHALIGSQAPCPGAMFSSSLRIRPLNRNN